MQWWCAAQGVPWTWDWRPYPGVWLFIAVIGATFLFLDRRGATEPRAERRRSGFFWWGLAILWVALDWPVGALGAGYLASIHMAQFLLIALVAPPFLLLGLSHLLPRGASAWHGRATLVATHPVATLAAFTVVLSATHWPPLVDALMVDQVGSFVLDLAWLGAGLMFWWPVIAPVPERAWLGPPVRIGYLIAATLVNTGVFAFLTFSDLPVYAIYELAPPVGSLSARDDQRIAGLVMKMGGALVLWTAITILFFRWFAEGEGVEGVHTRAPVQS